MARRAVVGIAGNAALTCGAALAVHGAGARDYDGIVAHYCNAAMDWGEIPERPQGARRLLQIQVFAEHGARTQAEVRKCWAGDDIGAFQDDLGSVAATGSAGTDVLADKVVETPGTLTIAGYKQSANNGKRLREAYVLRERLLPESFGAVSAGELDVRSTRVQRTRQSARAMLGGLFPDLEEGPLPYGDQDMDMVRTSSQDDENMLVNYNLCPAAAWRSASHFDGLGAVEEAQSFCRRYRSRVMSNQDCIVLLGHLMDCVMSRICPTVPFHPRNTTVPKDFSEGNFAKLKRLWAVLDKLTVGYFDTMVEGGAAGALAAEILEAADGAAVDGRGGAPKVKFYVGHSTGPMQPLATAFGLRRAPPYWPAFASMTIMEVWESDAGSRMIRWIANGKVAVGPVPFEEFRQRASAVAGTAARCRDSDPQGGTYRDAALLLVTAIVGVLLLACSFCTGAPADCVDAATPRIRYPRLRTPLRRQALGPHLQTELQQR